ncbi:MAG: hypothetical protein ACLVH8_05150 [Fusobacterium sp.]|mgnify:FL=1|uniref:hypothetical protein n=1 Tax=Fusobacterium sp. SB021 TaxID=2744227 RepID=UPI003A250068
MKKILKIFYFLVVIGILSALLYKEKELFEEYLILKNEQKKREKVIVQGINENYHPRKDDFYKK